MPGSLRAAVIVTTYQRPAWLEMVLLAYARQSVDSFRVVVADDGSGPETADVIRRLRPRFGDRLAHVWHEDRGFRKCEILNRAILAADADYLVFTDGDCLPREDFVATHLRLAEPGRFLSGGVVWLPRPLTERLTPDDVVTGRFAEPAWLARNGWRGGRRRLRMLRSRALATLLDHLTPTGATFNGHNSSVWRDAVLAVNGFDADMGYGGLDRALGERLENFGLRGKQVRHRAVVMHLDHDRPWRDPEVVRRNREIRARIRRSGEVRARIGIAELAAERGGAK
ncbi:MAG TPA: glycosyltransferase family 2 protein [Longimicrobiales bacterium]|nr:glycosyltransferase family 2 protein [Longimicrobiales bacterium]